MNYEQRTNKAFTLIELVVAIAILVMVFLFASVIFNVSIEAHRTAGANAEIMQKLRAITDQLNSDFKGIRKDVPVAIQFTKDSNNIRYDKIAFFSNGDFQSVRQYNYNKAGGGIGLKTVSGDVASIYYGQAQNPNILARKQKILTFDESLIDSPLLDEPDEFKKDSLAAWKVQPSLNYFNNWVLSLIPVEPHLEEYIPMYVTAGIANFTIQWAEWDNINKIFIWKPTNSNFDSWDTTNDGIFGIFFNIPEGVALSDWYDRSGSYPRALKFTFTLYDSKGILKQGRTFTHIVYVGG